MEEGMRKCWIVVFQFRAKSGWVDDLSRWWPCMATRYDALRLKAQFNTHCLAQRGERYVVRRVK